MTEAALQPRRPLAQFFWYLRRWPIIPILIIVTICICAVFADIIAPHDPIESSLRARNTPPIWYPEGTSKYILGADPQGRLGREIQKGTNGAAGFLPGPQF